MHENSPRYRQLAAKAQRSGLTPMRDARRSWREVRKFLASCGWSPADFDAWKRWEESAVGDWVQVRVRRPGEVAHRWLRWSGGFDIRTEAP